MKRVQDSGKWEPDSFEWVDDDRLFDDLVAMSEREAEAFLDAEAAVVEEP